MSTIRSLPNRSYAKKAKEAENGVTVDSTISSRSENPVQNKAIYNYLVDNFIYKNGIKTFLNQTMLKTYLNEDIGLPKTTLTFNNSSRATLDSSIVTYLKNNEAIGYVFNIELTNAFDGQPEGTISFEAMIISKSSTVIIDGSTTIYTWIFTLLMNEVSIGNNPSGSYKFDLVLPDNLINSIDIQVRYSYPKLYLNNSNGFVAPNDTNPVKGETVYNYIYDNIRPIPVTFSAGTLNAYVELVGKYANDVMAGLGKLWYIEDNELDTMKVYECFTSMYLDSNLGESVPLIRYIDLNGDIQTVNPSNLSGTNILMYSGYKYGHDNI